MNAENLCFYAMKIDDETFVHGYGSNTSKDNFFTDVAEKIAFDDCGDYAITKIVWQGQEIHYVGWQPGMKYEFMNDAGEIAWCGYFPEWDH